MVCLPEVINLHQKSNNVKMSFQHLQLSEPVFGLFLSNAQHRAFLQTQERKCETNRLRCRGRQADSVEQGQTVTQYIYSRTVLKYIISDFFFCYFMFLLHYISDGNVLRCMFMIATVTFQIKLLI